jgi:DNA-binding GntR family transcriptional regulator
MTRALGPEELVITPLGPDRTVEQVLVRELRSLIADGGLQPGVRLPYRTLAQQFQVSVTPVRMALRELAKEGLVEILPAGGVRVTSLSVQELEDLFASRVGPESWLARIGAPRLTDADLEEMEGCYRTIERAADARDRPSYVASAVEYRLLCYQAAGRPRLLESVRFLVMRSARYNRLTIDPDERFVESRELMMSFRSACIERDGRAAQAAVRAILDRSLEYLTTHSLALQATRQTPG